MPTTQSTDRGIPKSRRSVRTLKVADERATRQLVRIDQATVRLRLETQQVQWRRRNLPRKLPGVTAAQRLMPVLAPPGFQRELNPAVLGQVRQALLANSFGAVIVGVGEALSCDRRDLLLVHADRAVRRGVKVRILRLHYQFAPAFNEKVRATGQGHFDPRLKTWDVIHGPDPLGHLQPSIADHFAAVIDMDHLAVMVNPSGLPGVAASRDDRLGAR